MTCLHNKKTLLQDFNFSWGIFALFVTWVEIPSNFNTEIQIYHVTKVISNQFTLWYFQF